MWRPKWVTKILINNGARICAEIWARIGSKSAFVRVPHGALLKFKIKNKERGNRLVEKELPCGSAGGDGFQKKRRQKLRRNLGSKWPKNGLLGVCHVAPSSISKQKKR